MYKFMLAKILILLTTQSNLHFPAIYCTKADSNLCQNGTQWSVKRELTKTGFHRHLITTVHFQGEIKPGSKVLIEEILPDGIYLDPFDTELQQLKEIKVHTSKPVDVEKPANLSDDVNVFIYANLSRDASLRIPVHMRYQKPRSFEETGEYVVVEIPNPKLYTEISEMHSSTACKERAKMKPCINQVTTCSWTEIEYVPVNLPLKVDVPHGNADAQLYVVAVTFLFTSIGSLHVIVSVVGCYNNNKLKLN